MRFLLLVVFALAADLAPSAFARAAGQEQERSAGAYYIVGHISHPGKYPLDADMTVLEAIAKAGGLTANSDASRMTIVRLVDGEKVVKPATFGDPVEHNDTIYVPRRQ
jgi:polysaccharide export outer membrane protein